MTRDDQLLPDVLDGMSMSTGAGITDVEMREILADKFRAAYECEPRDCLTITMVDTILAAMRAVEARTRQATDQRRA